MKAFKIIFIIAVLLTVSATVALHAQITIGAGNAPQNFSVLELISNGERGMRLPQLTTDERDALALTFGAEKTGKAMGLQIFNTDTYCVETWNGTTWIQQCFNNTPATPPSGVPMVGSCLTKTSGTPDDTYTWSGSSSPFAVTPEKYEFFVGGVSQGKQTADFITLPNTTTDEVTVSIYYPAFRQSAVADRTFDNVNGSGISFIMKGVQGGTYTQGATDDDWAASGFPDKTSTICDGNTNQDYFSRHSVNISSFSMGETEVTQDLFESVMNCGDIWTSTPNYGVGGNYPAYRVSWYDAIAFCNKLSILLGKEPVYSVAGISDWANLAYSAIPASDDNDWNAAVMDKTKNGFRLPTEAEWEYAARGGINDHGYAYAGSDNICDVAWYDGNNTVGNIECGTPGGIYGTKPVQGKQANELGLYDMSGNVWEWCSDFLNVYPLCGRVQDPVQSDAGDCIIGASNYRAGRGNDFRSTAAYCRVSCRDYAAMSVRSAGTGFRMAMGQ